MKRIVEKNGFTADYYLASMAGGSLQLTPHCGCGNCLNEDYYCEKCQRKCRCTQLLCVDEPTLEKARHFIRKSSQFAGFTARLAKEG